MRSKPVTPSRTGGHPRWNPSVCMAEVATSKEAMTQTILTATAQAHAAFPSALWPAGVESLLVLSARATVLAVHTRSTEVFSVILF